MSATPTPDVRPGQVWADCDWRCQGRYVKVVAVEGDKAVVHACDAGGRVGLHGKDRKPRATRLSIRRMRPTSTGFRLHLDAPADTTPDVEVGNRVQLTMDGRTWQATIREVHGLDGTVDLHEATDPDAPDRIDVEYIDHVIEEN